MERVIRRSFGRIKINETLIIQVDLQERFRFLTHGFNHLIATGKFMINLSGALDIPMIVSQTYPKAIGPTVREIEEIYHPKVNVIEKSTFSIWKDQETQDMIRSFNPSSIIMYGMETHCCIQQSCLDLIEDEYDVHLILDGTSSQTKLQRNTAIRRLEQSGICMWTSDSLALELVTGNNDPRFKKILDCIHKRDVLPQPFDQQNLPIKRS